MIKIGVIGTGVWGKNHVRVWNTLPEVELIAISDASTEVTHKFSKQYMVKGETEYALLLKNPQIDAVSICTPAATHFSIAKAALEAGKHVLLEKPLALSTEEGRVLTELAKQTNKILMIGHIFRFDPIILRVKEEIKKGTIGNVDFLFSSRLGLMTPRPDCGVIFDFALHDIDIACFLLDMLPTAVTAVGKTFRNRGKRTFEDVGFITLYFPNETVVNISVSWLTPKKIRTLWVIGDKKTIGVDLVERNCYVYDKGVIPGYDSFGEFTLISKQGEDTLLHIPEEEPLKQELAHFADCVKNNKIPSIDGKIGTTIVQIIEACHRSIKEQRTVKVSYGKE